MITEKRAIPRFGFPGRVVHVGTKHKYDQSPYHYVSHDLSCHGMCLLTDDKDHLPAGSPVTVAFYADDPSTKVRKKVAVKGEVVSNNELNEERNRLGVRFNKITLEDQAIISTLSHNGVSMPDEDRLDYDYLKREIQTCSASMLKIVSGVIIVMFGYMGAVISQISSQNMTLAELGTTVSLLIATPMILLHVGSLLFCSEMERLRRAVSYIREYYSEKYKHLTWEADLYLQRKIKHTKISNFSLGYYNLAKYLGIMACALGIIKLSEVLFYQPDMAGWIKTLCSVAVFLLCLGWYAFYLPVLRDKIKWREGADGFEAECFCQWELIKKYKLGAIKDFVCVKRLFSAFFYPLDFRLLTMENLEKCETGTKDLMIKNYIGEFRARIERHKKRMACQPWWMAERAFIVLVYSGVFTGIVCLINRLFNNPGIKNYGDLVWCVLGGLFMVWVLYRDVSIKRIYYPFTFESQAREWYVLCDKLREPFKHHLDTRAGPLQFPPDSYITEKKVSPFLWSAYYSFNPCWAKKNRKTGVFEQFTWKPCSPAAHAEPKRRQYWLRPADIP